MHVLLASKILVKRYLLQSSFGILPISMLLQVYVNNIVGVEELNVQCRVLQEDIIC